MKEISCYALKGACNELITGNTPEEMGENSRAHVMEMVEQGDQAHKDAIEEMKKMPQEEQQKWYQGFVDSFKSLPDVE